MVEFKIDENLIDWKEITDHEWESIILGNGFSINIWEKFGYGTLYEPCLSGCCPCLILLLE